MSKGQFEQDLQNLLGGHEVQPPADLWPGVLRKLHRPGYLRTGGLVLLVAALSWAFWQQPIATNSEVRQTNKLPGRLILMIDTSFCEDGSLRLDTIFQELPNPDTFQEPRKGADREIDESWVIADPEHPEYVDAESYQRGRELFINYCATCHVIEKDIDLTGPSLAGITARRDQQWLYDFTRNSWKMIQEGEPQALEVWEEWRPTRMNNNESLADEELNDLYYYVANWEISD